MKCPSSRRLTDAPLPQQAAEKAPGSQVVGPGVSAPWPRLSRHFHPSLRTDASPGRQVAMCQGSGWGGGRGPGPASHPLGSCQPLPPGALGGPIPVKRVSSGLAWQSPRVGGGAEMPCKAPRIIAGLLDARSERARGPGPSPASPAVSPQRKLLKWGGGRAEGRPISLWGGSPSPRVSGRPPLSFCAGDRWAFALSFESRGPGQTCLHSTGGRTCRGQCEL